MEWKDQIAGFSAAEIVAALGCPPTTAYQWLDGKRSPPKWQQPIFLDYVKRRKPGKKTD